MPTHTDMELHKLLSKLLPCKLEFHNDLLEGLFYIDGPKVKDTELLQLCWDVECTLNREEHGAYCTLLLDTKITVDEGDKPIETTLFDEYGWFGCIHATWQQKVEALAVAKGINVE